NMKKIDLSSLKREKDFLIIDYPNYKVVFTTAENNRSFDKHTEEGLKALESIKGDFKVDEVVYISQVHSKDVICYTGDDISNIECDGIITNVKNIAIGAFTADCVPIILINEKRKVISAIHSGWKGTIKGIVKEALKKMEEEYNCESSETIAYIGYHNRVCSYEVSEELKELFLKETQIPEDVLFKGRNLNLEEVILKDLKEQDVKEENIYSLPLCTYCSSDIKLHSYRKSVGTYGRLFSFVILK
ncbi:MAG: peptidoglycan editing factor PgeF, partial [Clostridium sp.]